jgi:predicted MFS family arabinose efflux permease
MSEPAQSNKQAWYALAVLFGINLMNFFDRQILAAVTEPIRKEWMLSDTQMGAMGTAFILIYAVVGVPLGRWADWGQRRVILAVSVTIWSLFTAFSGFAIGYWSLFAARMGVGIGEAGCSPAGNSLLGDLFPPRQRARAISVFMLGLPMGIFLSNYLSGMIAKTWGWQAPFFVATVPGLILAFLALRIKEPERGAIEGIKQTEIKSTESPYKQVLKIPTIWLISLSGALHNFNAYAVNSFMPAYLGRYHALDLRQAATISAYVLGAVGVISLLFGGYLADAARRWRMNGRLLMSAIAFVVSTPLVYAALMRPKGDMRTFIILMAVGWMFFYLYYVTVYPAIQEVVEPHLRGTAMALYFFAMYILGGAFGTYVLGRLSDHYASSAMAAAGATQMTEAFKAAGLHDAFMIVPVISGALAVVLLLASLTVSKDMQKLQERMAR